MWREAREALLGEVSLAELGRLGSAGSRLRWLLLLGRETARSVQRHQSLTLASSLAFKTIVSLVPIMAVALAALAMLPQGVFDQQSGLTPAESFVALVRSHLDFPGRDQIIDSIQVFADNARRIALGGFLALFLAAFSLLQSIEEAFNAIWQVRAQRKPLGRLAAYLAILVLVPILMTSSVYLTARLATFTAELVGRLPLAAGPVQEAAPSPATIAADQTTSAVPPAADSTTPSAPAPEPRIAGPNSVTATAAAPTAPPPAARPHPASRIERWVSRLAGIVLTCLAMTLLFYLIPNTTVRWCPALAGGILAGGLVEGIGYFFRLYASYTAHNYTQIYGPLLALPFFLLLVWLAWAVVLLGAELVFTAQNFRDLAARAELERRGLSCRLYVAARVLLLAAADLRAGRKPEDLVENAAELLQLPPYFVSQVVEVLLERGLLRRLTGEGCACLPAKDIHRLTLGELVRAIRTDALEVPEAPEDALRERLAARFARAAAAEHEELDRLAIADLLED